MEYLNIFSMEDQTHYYHWIANLTLFSGKTYDEQLNLVSDLNQGNRSGYNTWTIASGDDLDLLWSLDAELLIKSFWHTLIDDSYNIIGRFNALGNNNEHQCARIRKPMNPPSGAIHDDYYDFLDNQKRQDVGAWVLTKIPKQSSLTGPHGFKRT